MGRTSDPHGVIRGGDMLLITGISEAMPVSSLEAMAQGRPSVADLINKLIEAAH